MGIPYRRGHLYYGPPGNGKTSLIKAIAGHFKMNIKVLNLTSSNIDDSNLSTLLANSTEDIILIEDIDSVIKGREVSGDTLTNALTFSGVLNALDGIISSNGRIIIMTTNHIEDLDEALIRPGRIDEKIYIGNGSLYQIKELYNRFYKENRNDLQEYYIEYSLAMAQVQGIFLENKDNPTKALNELKIKSNGRNIDTTSRNSTT